MLFIQDIHNSNTSAEDGDPAGAGPKPRGFREEELRKLMTAAGLEDVRYDVLPEKFGVELLNEKVVTIDCFIATGTKSL
jgi:hypothetical protein